MYQMCVTINNVKHCFPIPVQIDLGVKPPPNFPELELAIAVESLVEKVEPEIGETELTRAVSEASTRFIQKVQKELPKGVELTRVSEQATQRKAA